MLNDKSVKSALKSFRRGTGRTIIGGTMLVAAIEVTTDLPSQGRSSQFYHTLADKYVVPAMRRFLSPENAHKLALKMAFFAPTHRPSVNEQQVSVAVNLWENCTFPNPIGLAAGYDKDGTAIRPLLGMGFGFVEIGSVCLQPQPGNPSPRMFRLLEDAAIINRYGFNSAGACEVEKHLKTYCGHRDRQPMVLTENQESWLDNWLIQEILHCFWTNYFGKRNNITHQGLLGLNLGKNKTSSTPIQDYQALIYKLGKYCDYLVINVSSPNTPGLRDLQNTCSLEQILIGCQKACAKVYETEDKQTDHQQQGLGTGRKLRKKPPLLVKLSPDLLDSELEEIAIVLLKLGIDGIILTNTTTTRPKNLTSVNKHEIGGLSGRPLKKRSTECIRLLYKFTKGEIPIIGVGGIENGYDAYQKLRAGASLVQVYSSLIYNGPGMVSEIRDEIAQLMIKNGQRDIDEVIGSDHHDLFMERQKRKLTD